MRQIQGKTASTLPLMCHLWATPLTILHPLPCSIFKYLEHFREEKHEDLSLYVDLMHSCFALPTYWLLNYKQFQ